MADERDNLPEHKMAGGNQPVPPEIVAAMIKLQNKCWTQARIGEYLGYHHVTVNRVLKRHNDRVYEKLTEKIAATKGKQVQVLDTLVDELYQEWEKSKQPRQQKKRVERPTKKSKGKLTVVREESTAYGQTGNAVYISEIIKCMELQRKILMESGAADADIKASDARVREAVDIMERIKRERASGVAEN